jgi:hypothetical protein
VQGLRRQAGGLAEDPLVTRAATSVASATEVFDEHIKTLTENGIHKMRRHDIRAEPDQKLETLH